MLDFAKEILSITNWSLYFIRLGLLFGNVQSHFLLTFWDKQFCVLFFNGPALGSIYCRILLITTMELNSGKFREGNILGVINIKCFDK